MMFNIPEAKKLTEEKARALILQALFSAVGRGEISEGQITRFCVTQSGRGFTTYRCEKIIHKLVKEGSINVNVSVSEKGRISRRYCICIEGILQLTALSMSLPKHSRHETQMVLEPIYQAAMAVFAQQAKINER